jgi:FlaA1/EpsC-like NDP-sugar epimerase
MRNIPRRLLVLSRSSKMALQVAVDAISMLLSFVVAVWLRLESLVLLMAPKVWLAVVPALLIGLFLLHMLGFYRAIIRYISARALRSVLVAACGASLLLGGLVWGLGLPVPRTVPLIFGVLFFLSIGSSRYIFREATFRSQNQRRERVVIYGAGAAGRQLAQTLREGADYVPIAFLDEDPRAQGSYVAGLRVHPRERIDHLIRHNSISSVLLAIPSASKSRRNTVLKWLEQFPVTLHTIPGLQDIVSGAARIDELNEVALEDLLGRAPIPPREDLLGANIYGKSVLVTGAGGSIGSELCRQIIRQGPRELVLLDLSEAALYAIEQELLTVQQTRWKSVRITSLLGSVQDAEFITRCLTRFGIQTVYHAAAFKHVPLVEHNVAEGIRNNVFGTRVVVEAAVAAGVEAFILVSTDKAVRPTNIMGASKRLAELVCQATAQSAAQSAAKRTTISMVRFGNVLGSSGSVIPLFRRQIAAGGPLTVTHPDITRYFMTIPEAAQLVIQAGAMARGGDVYVLDMGQPIRIVELAAQMARLHGLKAVFQTEKDDVQIGPGEIGIVFTQLRPGEKLYEELIIGTGATPTSHPRILTTTERHMTSAALRPLLAALHSACQRSDVAAIQALLIEAGTAYEPQSAVVDHFARMAVDAAPLSRPLSLLSDRTSADRTSPDRPNPDPSHLTLVIGGTDPLIAAADSSRKAT